MKTPIKITLAAVALCAISIVSALVIRNRNPLSGADWINNSSNDTLEVFCSKGMRGYFNVYTSEIVIPAQYERAWIFSEGLAAVQRNKLIGFINHSGDVVIDFKFDVGSVSDQSFLFKYGHCVIPNSTGKYGVIDRNGVWMVAPEYDAIDAFETYAIVTKGMLKMQVSYDGNILNPFVVDNVEELRFYEHKRKKTVTGEIESVCQDYPTGKYVYTVNERCGLMDSDFKPLTPPLYTYIEAINKDSFEAALQDNISKVLLDSKGSAIRIVDEVSVEHQ